MYYNDHNPPHFHAKFAEHEIQLSIDRLETLKGTLPRPARGLVLEWASEHRDALMQNWELARQGARLLSIEPLK